MNHTELTREGSIMHGFDPRIKFIIAFLFSIVTALSISLRVTILFALLAVVLILLSRPRLKILVLRLAIVNSFIIFLWLIIPCSYPGETAFYIGLWPASVEGLINALMITLKCNAIVLCNIALLSTNTIFQLSHAIRHLGAPDKFVHLFFLIHRYGLVLFDEYRRIRDTLKVRGFNPRTNIFTYRTYAYIMANLLLKGYERSEQVHRAMICRGFTGKYWVLEHFKMKSRDIYIAAVIISIITALTIIQWTTQF